MTVVEDIIKTWSTKLAEELSGESDSTRQSILTWLIGPNPERFNDASEDNQQILVQALNYRYQILQQRYWGVSSDRAYRNLIKRLSSLFLVRSKVRTWIALSRDRRRTVTDVLQEVIQEMLRGDRYLKEQVSWIGECTPRSQVRDLLMLATLEEYCMRPIRNQPLLVYRFVNYLRRSQRGGMTNIPSGELIRLISEEVGTDEAETSLSLLDVEAVSQYEERTQAEEEQMLREQVKKSFATYLYDKLDKTAVEWLELHLQGFTQDAISQRLNLSTKAAYRLREKIRYHAIYVFTLKEQPDLVLGWLKTSLKEHNLGLVPEQWETFQTSCSPLQQKIMNDLKAGCSFDDIAEDTKLKLKQITGEWANLYLAAQNLRQDAQES
ncbi:HetZ-related protein 2 [Oscillatoria sp. CS-180]|nr:HetZ-related protein 2 [Oscillatoria sp. CS-180]